MGLSHSKIDAFVSGAKNHCPDIKILLGENLAPYTTYKIGGPAVIFFEAQNANDVTWAVTTCKKTNIQYFILGGGSNLLVNDMGFDGVVIKLGDGFKKLECDPKAGTIKCGSAVSFAKVANTACKNGLSGMQFAAGTPGSIGGALKMNAGTATDWIGSRVKNITVCNQDGEIETLKGKDLTWGYRKSIFADDTVILQAEFALEPGHDSKEIEAEIQTIMQRRHANQPLGKKSCGCSFKNPDCTSAGKLIEDAGLKGASIGKAKVSEIHANFIENTGDCTCQNVVDLMCHIQRVVYSKFNVKLQSEVKFVGFSKSPLVY